jgi:deazaflavin-dependent oxidoreductase (nitroreductase family)
MPSDWNTKVIDEFRANGGTVSNFGGSLLLLHTTGARTGREHITPVMYRTVDDGYAVFASFAGQPVNPAWYHNLVANPDVQAEIGTQTLQLRARVADDSEREPIWVAHKTEFPGFAEYETKTTRQIPVVILEPVG